MKMIFMVLYLNLLQMFCALGEPCLRCCCFQALPKAFHAGSAAATAAVQPPPWAQPGKPGDHPQHGLIQNTLPVF